jgi:hypothetical protein
MKRRFTIYCLLLLTGFAVIFFCVRGPKGKPFITMDQLETSAANVFEKLKAPYHKAKSCLYALKKGCDVAVERAKSLLPEEDKPPPAKTYKWKDEHGKWHYSDKPRDP